MGVKTIFLVHLADLDIVATSSYNGVVRLVEIGYCCDGRSGNMSERMKIEIVDDVVYEFQEDIDHDALEEESDCGILLEDEHLE